MVKKKQKKIKRQFLNRLNHLVPPVNIFSGRRGGLKSELSSANTVGISMINEMVGCQMVWNLNTGPMDAILFSYVLVWYSNGQSST